MDISTDSGSPQTSADGSWTDPGEGGCASGPAAVLCEQVPTGERRLDILEPRQVVAILGLSLKEFEVRLWTTHPTLELREPPGSLRDERDVLEGPYFGQVWQRQDEPAPTPHMPLQ